MAELGIREGLPVDQMNTKFKVSTIEMEYDRKKMVGRIPDRKEPEANGLALLERLERWDLVSTCKYTRPVSYQLSDVKFNNQEKDQD